ncbi:MAG: 6-phosphofructokinase [Anaerolineae bacterium]|nr:6-phosphofructokinase [Anaerolineae bacterium]
MAGNLLVAQSGGPTAVINASLAGVVQTAIESGRFDRVLGALDGTLGILRETLVDLTQEEPAVWKLVLQTPGAALGTSRLKLTDAHYDRILAVLKAHDVHYLCLIGGNDSMDSAYKLSRLAEHSGYELLVVGVPKTVDNDLAYTDHCPGYGSAARFVAVTVRDTCIDSWSGKLSTPVKIVEIMGRHAGWLTASAALARESTPDGAPHLIYVPERPVTLEQFLEDVETVYRQYGYAVVALSEGVRNPQGELLGTAVEAVDAFGHRQLGGVSAILAEKVSERLRLKARFEKPDTMQRSSSALVSHVDREEAFRVGQEAVRAVLQDISGKMVTLEREEGPAYHCRTGLADLDKVAGVERLLPDAYLNANDHDVTPAFLDYVRPLIGDPFPPVGFLRRYPVPAGLPPWAEA